MAAITLNGRISWCLTSVSMLAGLAACDGGGKWVEAPDVQSVYEADAKIQAMMKKSGPPDTSCKAIIGSVRESLKDPQSSGVKLMMRSCGNAGMQFGDDIRCKDGRMQIKCR